ncbi:MAG: Uma2 family endonuclease [Deltaproteobacteria bacterium]|nr:Uma2 family endonuclease [Deltaproteobacteria bacterium]
MGPPSSVVISRPTFREIISGLPSHLRGEVINGRLTVMPRPAPRHANAAGALQGQLGPAFQRGLGGPGGWWILAEPELTLGDPAFEPIDPDLVGWRIQTMPHLPDTAAVSLVPDWVCEILSPSTEVYDRAEKLPYYARAGIRHAWLVYPEGLTLEAFENDAGIYRPVGTWQGHTRARVPPFDAIDLDLSWLWMK